VSGGVAEVFRSAGERYLAAFLGSLPTDEDRSRFVEAARLFLSFDQKIRNLPPGPRRVLLRAPIKDANQKSRIIAELWGAATRLLREDAPSDRGSELDIQFFGARVLMARLIVGGLQDTSHRDALLKAALLLRELGDSAGLIRSKSGGKSSRLEALSESSAEHKRRSALLKTEAEKLRKRRPDLSQSARASHLNRQLQRQGQQPWTTNAAMLEYARRNGIKI
jgi:hypothetical protein